MFKKFIQKKLQKSVKKYFELHREVKLITVSGSIDKASTAQAIADILSQRYRIRMHESPRLTKGGIPLAILGIDYPERTWGIFTWMTVFRAVRMRVNQPSDTDIVIQVLNTKKPGDLAVYGEYLNPDIAVITSVTPEHMKNFESLEAVAKEQLSVMTYAKHSLINRDDIEGRFADLISNTNFTTYGSSATSEYRFEINNFVLGDGYSGNFILKDGSKIEAKLSRIGEQSLRTVTAGVAVGDILGVLPDSIRKGAEEVKPVPGRMNLLKGMQGTWIIDDTYKSSPAASQAALQTLYSIENVPSRIAVFGDMHNLGDKSADEHQKLGSMCNPNMLAWLVVVGPDATGLLAPAARNNGCQVYVARDAIEAASFVRSVTEEGSVVLVNGSRDGLYLEECVKLLCNMTEDAKLVRQSNRWLEFKKDFFSRYSK